MLLYRLLTGAATGPAPAPTSSSSAPPNTSPLFTSLPFLEFCSVFARNVSEYSSLHGLLVRSLDLDRFLMALVRFKDDVLLSLSSGSGGGSNGSTATGVGVGGGGVSAASVLTKNNLSVTSFEQDSLDRLYDITVMLYHLSRYRLYPSSGPSSALSGPSGTSSSSRLHVMTPLSVLNIISEVTSHANGDRLLSHITKLIIGLVVDKTEDGNGFDPSFIREILTEINDQDSLDEEQVAAFMRPKLTMRYLQLQGKGTSASGASSNSVSLCQSPQLQPLSLRTVEQRSLEVLSKEEINALWIPLISNERKKMEYFPVIASSAPSVPSAAGGGVGAASSSLSIDAVLPFPMASYDKIIKRYPFVTEPVLLEAKREREDKILSSFALASATAAAGGRGGGGAGEGELGLGVLEEQEEMEDFPNTTTADFDERNGIPSPGHAAVERRDMASPVPPSPATSSYPLSSSLSPRPPESPQRSNPNMSHKSAGRLLVQAKGSGGGGGSSSSIHRDLSSSYDSTGSGSGARKRTASS
jgi:hypothetical protein